MSSNIERFGPREDDITAEFALMVGLPKLPKFYYQFDNEILETLVWEPHGPTYEIDDSRMHHLASQLNVPYRSVVFDYKYHTLQTWSSDEPATSATWGNWSDVAFALNRTHMESVLSRKGGVYYSELNEPVNAPPYLLLSSMLHRVQGVRHLDLDLGLIYPDTGNVAALFEFTCSRGPKAMDMTLVLAQRLGCDAFLVQYDPKYMHNNAPPEAIDVTHYSMYDLTKKKHFQGTWASTAMRVSQILEVQPTKKDDQ